MGNKNFQTAIDLSDLGMDQITETQDAFIIGAMTSLRTLELHEGMAAYTNGAMKESLRHIVGVQFRNGATVGGSIYGRFGFSDVLTMFLAMDTCVELYKGGIIPLEEFAEMPYDKDVLVNVIVKKKPMKIAYESFRNTKTDFPVLACAVSATETKSRVVIGARPQKAKIYQSELTDKDLEIEENVDNLGQKVKDWVITGDNMRASAAYRKHLAKVLTKRACHKICEKGE